MPFELFVGRASQVAELLQHAREAAGGRLKVGFLTGDRGIGKTSLARFATVVAEREHALLGLHVVLGGADDAPGMVHRVFDRLANVARGGPLWARVGKLFGDRVRAVGLFGLQVEFRPATEDLEALTRGFDRALRSVVDRLDGGGRRGLFIVLDDINGLASSPTFATWLKDLVDTVAVDGRLFPVFLLFVGLDRVRRELVSYNESVARVFIPLEVTSWSDAETSDFYRRAFARVGMTVDDAGLDLMTEYIGGLPVLAHEIGDAAFRFAAGSVISRSEARRAVISAANVVGHKYFAPQVFDRVRSPRDRSLLRTIPKTAPSGRFKRAEILQALRGGALVPRQFPTGDAEAGRPGARPGPGTGVLSVHLESAFSVSAAPGDREVGGVAVGGLARTGRRAVLIRPNDPTGLSASS